ncbi:MAG: energy-coupling factor ABC transporter ATP-binding protein [Halanaeroarchaeum sp.]
MTVLVATDLAVTTAAGDALVDGVSLAVDAGETVVVAGPSGSGKTTVTKALGGLLDSRPNLAVEGSVERPGNVGFLFQNPKTQLVRRTVEHDVAFGLENRGVPRAEMRERIREWAERLDATRYLDRAVDELSRGETAVVVLLGALVTEPDVLVLDEPLAPLDAPNRRLVLETIETLQARGTALLVAEHDLRDLLPVADRVLVLESGRVTARGPVHRHLHRLRSLGLRLPFATEVALERGVTGEAVPLDAGGSR